MSVFFFGHTMTVSSAYYRMIGFADKFSNEAKVFYNEWDPVKYNNRNRFFEEELCNESTRPQVVKEFGRLGNEEKVDIWVFQLFATPWGLSLMDTVHKHWNKPFVTEVDDCFLNVPGHHTAYDNYSPNEETLRWKREQVEESSMVICSTEYLRDKLLYLNNNIRVIPNAIDFSKWKKRDVKNHQITIGWEGGIGHQPDLELLEFVIPEIVKKYPDVQFQFVGYLKDSPWLNSIPNVKVLNDWVSIDKWADFKAELNWDIELAPLVDTEFNRCKSNLRWLEASALKIPLVASNVEPYKKTNALLCKSDKDWINNISLLIENEIKRKEIGDAAYKLVRKDFNINRVARLYETILNCEITRVNSVIEQMKAKAVKK